MATWINDLPSDLQESVKALLSDHPQSEPVLSQLAAHYASEAQDKRRKTNSGRARKASQKAKPKNSAPPAAGSPSLGLTKVEVVSKHVLNITSPIIANEIIFQLPGLSFLSPARRKFSLVFHLYMGEDKIPLPVLSVVNATTEIPEISVTHLSSATELCLMIPILGNSTVSTKKDTVMMALWLKDAAAVTDGKNEPIICTLNLDVVKKQLTDAGKIPPHAEAQFSLSNTDNEAVKPINELIIDFLQRQFNLCGVKLINLLPSASPGKNSLNMNDDNVICLSQNADTHNDLVMAAAYKGSKEGALLLVATSRDNAYLVFGFKKPILLMNFTTIKAVSYSNITRFTFSMLVTVVDTDGVEISHDFGMIDQKSFQAIDDFVKRMNIDDNSFDEKHREKRAENKNEAAEGESGNAEAEPVGSDDEEEDGTYTGAVEEEGSGSGSEVDEEFDSNVESGSEDDADENDEDDVTNNDSGKESENAAHESP
ncbi:hypothetical protein OXX79_003634 [Metschnikowia pulcherrima]